MEHGGMKKFTLGFIALLAIALGFVHWFLPGILERTHNTYVQHQAYQIRDEVAALHDSLFVADLHADSLLWKRNLLRRSKTGHLDLPRLQQGNVALQVFSATTKSPKNLNYSKNTADSDDITTLAIAQFWPIATWHSIYERARYQLQLLFEFADSSDGMLDVVLSKSDMQALVKQRNTGRKVVGGLFLIEGGHPLEGDLDNLDRLFDQGLRIAGLVHFFDNELGGSLHGVGGGGLTPFGRQVIQRGDELGLIFDVAHASPRMVRDVLALTNRPVVLSHGGVKGQCDQNRNLEDSLMQDIARKGGVLGVGYWQGAVCDVSPDGIVRSIRYAINLMGEDHVALGSDYDGAVAVAMDASELAILTQTMLDQGFTETEIRKVMGENVKRFLLEHLPD